MEDEYKALLDEITAVSRLLGELSSQLEPDRSEALAIAPLDQAIDQAGVLKARMEAVRQRLVALSTKEAGGGI